MPASVVRPEVTKTVKVAGLYGISTTTKAVMVRVSATAGQSANVLVHSCGGTTSYATTLAVEPGAMAIGTAPVTLSNGQLCVTSSATASVRVTVVAKLAASGVGGSPVTARRVLDTRTATKLAANQLITIPPASLGAASGLKAITATFTILNPSSGGTLTITPCGSTEMKAPFSATAVTSFSTLIRVSAAGLCVKSTVATDLLIDVDGVWSADGPSLSPLAPVRVFDSRGIRTAVGSSPVTIPISSAAIGAQAAVGVVQANLTLISGSGPASVFIWPCSQPQPAASVAVVGAGKTAAFSVLVAVSTGAMCAASNAPVDLVVDVVGAG